MKKWIYHNCNKDSAWIIIRNIRDILATTNYDDNKKPNDITDIKYVHCALVNANQLTAIIEFPDGYLYVNNVKTVNEDVATIKSIGHFCSSLEKCVAKISNNMLEKLNIPKNIKPDDKWQEYYPYMYGRNVDNSDLIKSMFSNSEIVNLGNFYFMTGNEMVKYLELDKIKSLILYNNYCLTDYNWCKTAINLINLEIINMPHFNNNSIAKIVENLPNLKILRIHSCLQITIKCLMDIYKSNIEELVLNNEAMLCQPNAYSGLISENEWAKMGNYSITKLLINSNNLSLDIIDYIRTTCHKLNYLILNNNLYGEFRSKLKFEGNIKLNPINIVSSTGKKIIVGRDFEIQGLLKQNFQKPFSEQMERIIKHRMMEETLDDD